MHLRLSYQSLIAVMVASFLSYAGPLIFFLCKGSPSVIRQVPVEDSLSLHKFHSSLPHFLLNGMPKENGVFRKISLLFLVFA